jgi:hypothetical protein
MILNYNVHDVVKFQVIRKEQPFYEIKPLDMEYSYFRTDKPIKPDIIVRIGKFKPKNNDCFIIDHKFFVRKNYLYFKEPTWELEIDGFESDKTTVNFWEKNSVFNTFRYSSLVLCDQVIRPLLELKLAKKGYLLSHSAAVSKDNRGILLCGPAASYKTTIAMNFVKNGYKLLGDDFVIIKSKKLFAFPRSPVVFDYRIKKLDTEELSFFDKVKIRTNYKNQKSTVLINSSELSLILFPIISDENKFEVTKIDSKIALRKLIINNELEDSFSQFYQYSLAYSIIFSKQLLWSYLENIIDIKNIPCFIVKLSKNNFKKVLGFVEKLK